MSKRLKKMNFRWAKPALVFLFLAGLLFYLNSSPPFMAIASDSMSPTLSRGDLILTNSIAPDQIQEGDIIVYRVPKTFQDRYGYPATVSHRVIRIQNSNGQLTFRTKGDNAGEDPFMVLPDQVIGKESHSIPFLGYAVMFPQSRQGWFFLIGLAILYLIYKNSDSLVKGARRARASLFGVSTTEFINSQRELEQKMNSMSDQVAQSMNAFSAAMSEYARHIASHTDAVKSLAQAAKHLDMVASKQEERLVKGNYASETAPYTVKKRLDLDAPEITPELKAKVTAFMDHYINKQDGGPADNIAPKETVDRVHNY